MIEVKRRLFSNKPYAYEVEYLESTGTQYIDTGFAHTNKSGVEIKTQLTKRPSEKAFPFGGRYNNNSMSRAMFYYFTNGGQWGFDYTGSGNRWNVSGVGMLDVCEVAYLQNKVTINDKSYTFSSRAFTSPYTIYLFACNTGGTVELESRGAMKIWYCRLYEDNVLKHNFIPVVDLEGVPCLYDKITKEFFYNKGAGQFIAGPRVY